MAYILKNGQGSLFPNQKREKDTHPNMTGKLVVPDGVQPGDELRVAAWTKESERGKWLSLSAEKAQPREGQDVSSSDNSAQSNDDFEDSIPF
jgi:hypothetical protein